MLPGNTSSISELVFHFMHEQQPIRYSIWLSGSLPIHTIVFLGTVQVGKLPAWLAHYCPPGVAVAQGAPHWMARADGSDLTAFMQHFTESVFKNVVDMEHTDMLRVIVDSQATPNVLELLAQDPYLNLVESLLLIQPLALNSHAFANNPIGTFKQRVKKNLRYQLPFIAIDRRLAYNHKQILQRVGYHNARADAQYAVGLSRNSIGDLRRLHDAHIPITIISGEKDELFPPHEIKESLREGEINIPLIVVKDTPHSPLPSKQGMRLFRKALDVLRD